MNSNQTPEKIPQIPPEITAQAPEIPLEASQPTLKKALLGGAFLSVAILAGIALIIGFLPDFTTETQAQAAASAGTSKEFFSDIELKARSAYVYDAEAKKELFAKNATQQLPLASITKIALVLAVTEVLPPDSHTSISRESVEKGGGGLTWGEEWRVKDLIDFTLITSSNTGAEALREAADPLLAAKYPQGTGMNATVWRMNAIAQELEMNETYFLNPSGLDESPTQAGALSSARDIATLFAHAARTEPGLFSNTTQSGLELGPINAPARIANNTNGALSIEGLRMGKTGTTDLAGANIAVAFDVEGHTVVVVVLGSTFEGRFDDVRALSDAARKAVLEAL